MERRDAMFGLAAAAAFVGCRTGGQRSAPTLTADPDRVAADDGGTPQPPRPGDHHHEGHDHAHDGDDTFARTVHDCLAAGDACAIHCRLLLGQGDREMADCAASVDDMLATVEAIRKLHAAKSKHTKAQARVAAAASRTCEEACRQHAAKHASCKRCMEACAKTAAACDALG